jgi:hypothetical protein
MTNPFTESVVEEAALEWCGALGYQVVFEPTIAPGSRARSERNTSRCCSGAACARPCAG